MNLWTIILTIVGLVQSVGLALFVASARRAPEGFQDSDGFHLGTQPNLPPAPVVTMDSGEDTLPPFGNAA